MHLEGRFVVHFEPEANQKASMHANSIEKKASMPLKATTTKSRFRNIGQPKTTPSKSGAGAFRDRTKEHGGRTVSIDVALLPFGGQG